MGAINYGTGKYINLGYDLSENNCLYNEVMKHNINDEEYQQAKDELYYNICYEYDKITELIESYNFELLDIQVLSGYYEGFYLDISFEYCYFNDYQEKQATLKEVTKLKKLMFEIIKNYNIVNCQNGWGTVYNTYEETKEKIKEAIKEIKQDIKQTPTSKKYWKEWKKLS